MTNKYVNPAICAHRKPEFKETPREVWYQCNTCGLSGPPVRIKLLKFWAKNLAARGFCELANAVDKSMVVLMALLTICCSVIVPEKSENSIDASQNDLIDAADDDQSDSSENSDSVDTLDTSDTDTDTDTDTDGCPWVCKPELSGETAPFACSDPWLDAPTAVVNRLGDCPDRGLCCQPWPPPDHPMAVRDLCGNGWACESICPSGVLSASVCFKANEWCCEELETWSI